MRVCGERMGTRDRSQASTVRKACRGCLRMSFLVRSVRLQLECVNNSWVRRNRQLRAALNVLRPLTTTRYGIEPSASLKPEIRASERERERDRERGKACGCRERPQHLMLIALGRDPNFCVDARAMPVHSFQCFQTTMQRILQCSEQWIRNTPFPAA